MIEVDGDIDIVMEVGVEMSKQFPGIEFKLKRPAKIRRIPDGGPIELIGAMERDPATGLDSFVTTAFRFNPSKEELRTKDIVKAYTLASKGNRKALDAVEALAQKNFYSFRRSLNSIDGYRDDDSSLNNRRMSI